MKMNAAFRRATMDAAVAAALVAAPGAQALEAAVSGHVNRLITQVDDGVDSDLFHADNINSQTRFRFTGIHEVSPGLKAGIVWEMGFTSNPSNSISFANRTVAATLNERHVDAFLQGGWGKLSMGQGDGAANGGMEVDLSGTTVIQYSGVADIGGGFAFRNGNAFGPTIASTIDNLDFESRYDRVRYDTPKFGPASVAVSYGVKGNNNVGEVALWISGDAGSAGRIAGALGYSNEELPGVAGNEQIFGGSVSWLLPAGLNLTVGYGNSEDDTPGRSKKKFSYVKAGYKGVKHAVSVDFGKGEDIDANGDEADVVGIGYVYTPQKWIELYAGVKRHSLDRPGLSLDDVSFVTAGTRIKF